jgi:hypothetical protein
MIPSRSSLCGFGTGKGDSTKEKPVESSAPSHAAVRKVEVGDFYQPAVRLHDIGLDLDLAACSLSQQGLFQSVLGQDFQLDLNMSGKRNGATHGPRSSCARTTKSWLRFHIRQTMMAKTMPGDGVARRVRGSGQQPEAAVLPDL